MSLMQAPVGIMLMHRTMVQEELDRNRHPRRDDLPRRRQSPLMTLRIAIGRTLIAAGTRLDQQHDRAEPAVGRLSAAR
jgi:hypothetical protein